MRGLKWSTSTADGSGWCRTRKGAWIEMLRRIPLVAASLVAPVRVRGLKYCHSTDDMAALLVAPVRVRGLKSHTRFGKIFFH